MRSASTTKKFVTILLFGLCLLGLSPAVQAALKAAAATPNSVTLTWTAPGDDGTSGTASVYDVRYSLTAITEGNWDSATPATGEPSPQPAGSPEEFTVVGLTPSTTYYFAVKTGDEVPNWSTISNVITKTTSAEDTPPAVIADLVTGSPTATSLTLSWTAPGDDGNSGTASQYDVRYSTSIITAANFNTATQASGAPVPSSAGSAESFVISGLSSEQTYYFAIKTADEVPNWSAISNVASGATSTETIAPSAVANLGAGSPSEHSITLSWTAPGDDGNSGTASQYDIRYANGAITEATWDEATPITGEPVPQSAGNLETFEVDGLNSGTTYYFALKTADEVPNWSGISNSPGTSTQADATPPVAVATLNAILPTRNSLTLLWVAPGDDGSEGTASEYDIRYSVSPINESNWALATQISGEPTPQPAGTPETLLVSGLNEGQTYYFALKAADEMPNWSELSNVASNTTAIDNVPPSPINDLSATTGEEDGEIDLVWTAPGDDGMSGIATAYAIRYSTEPVNEETWESAVLFDSPPAPQPAGNEQSVTVGNLIPGEVYYVGIKAYDDALNASALSNAVNAEARFTFIAAADDIAELSQPPLGATLPTSQPVLEVTNANSDDDNIYRFELATDSAFFGLVASGLVQQTPGGTTSWKIPAKLTADNTYFWRVATNDVGYSDIFSFSVTPFTHAYPNPVKLSSGEQTTFTDLPEGSDLVLMSVSGSVVKQWANISGDDIVWNGTNEAGHEVASGVYMWYVSESGAKGKLMVLR